MQQCDQQDEPSSIGAQLLKQLDFDGVRIDETPYGLGVFATQCFSPDDPVGPVSGEVINDQHYSSNYCMDLGGSLSLNPVAPFRFLNHCCTPNCLLVHYTGDSIDATDHGLWIEAIKEIEQGDQLTIDYAWPAENAIQCGCDSDQCRGWIVDADQADQLSDMREGDEYDDLHEDEE